MQMRSAFLKILSLWVSIKVGIDFGSFHEKVGFLSPNPASSVQPSVVLFGLFDYCLQELNRQVKISECIN